MTTKFAFYTETTGSSLNSASIGSGSIQTYHLSASSVTPAKADLTQGWDFSGGTLSVATPSAPAEAAPRSYVLSSISESLGGGGGGGVSNAAKGAVRTVLIGNDEIVSYFSYNAASKTLTLGMNENINNLDINGITDFAVNDRLLFAVPQSAACFSASGSWSGIYTITTVGIPDPLGTPPVLTRADDFNSIEDVISGSFVLATSPSSSLDIWYLKTSGSITFEATPLLFASASFGGSGGGGSSYTGSPPIQVAGSQISIRPASATQSGYINNTEFSQLQSVISYSAIPTTMGMYSPSPLTSSNTETVSFNIGSVPANTIWAVKFNAFSFDTANPVNQLSSIGACAFYRSGSNDPVQVGNIEVEHTFTSGTFTYISMSSHTSVSGNVDFVMRGINTYNIKHWAKFQVTEFTYA